MPLLLIAVVVLSIFYYGVQVSAIFVRCIVDTSENVPPPEFSALFSVHNMRSKANNLANALASLRAYRRHSGRPRHGPRVSL